MLSGRPISLGLSVLAGVLGRYFFE